MASLGDQQPDAQAGRTIGELTLALAHDPVRAVDEATKAAVKELEKSASLFVAGFGFALMFISILDELAVTSTQHRLSSGNFLAVLLSGLALLLVGAGFRMFLGYRQSQIEAGYKEWLQARAAKEADVQIARTDAMTQAAIERGSVSPTPPVNP